MRHRHKTMRRGRRVKRGGSIMGWLKKANTFLRKHKVLSTGASLFAKSGLPYASQIGQAGKIANMAGYGRRGRGTTPAGGALRLAGMGCRRRGRRCR
jgi:hypothetical protein